MIHYYRKNKVGKVDKMSKGVVGRGTAILNAQPGKLTEHDTFKK